MSVVNGLVGRFISGESIYPEIRRGLNLVLNISIASYLYTLFYGPYIWFDASNYKSIIDFIVKGHFFIPFSFFIVVYAGTQAASWIVFYSINLSSKFKLKKKIINYDLDYEDKEAGKEVIKKISKYTINKDVSDEELTDAYHEFEQEYDLKVELESLENDLIKPKNSLEANFHLIFRMIIAISIYKFVLPDYTLAVYLLVLTVLILSGIFFIYAYKFLDILPTILLKIPEVLKSDNHETEDVVHKEMKNSKSDEK